MVLETTIILFIVFTLAIAIIFIFKNPIESLLETSIYSIVTGVGLFLLVITFLILILFVGIIPSLSFSRVSLVVAYSNFVHDRYKLLKKGLIFVQISITSVMLLMLLNINSLYHNLTHDNLGYNYHNIFYTAALRNQNQTSYSIIINQIKALPQVDDISTASFLLQARNSNIIINLEEVQFSYIDFGFVNHNTISIFDIKTVHGCPFSASNIVGEIMVSESFATKLEKVMNWKDGVLGKTIESTGYDHALTIVGVFEDINTNNAISPVVGP